MDKDKDMSSSMQGQSQDEVIAFRGTDVASRRPLRTGMTVGRAADADLQLEDAALSRIHAMFLSDAGRWFVVDQSSLNGTFLNGRKLAPMQLAQITSGDVMVIGSFQLRFELSSPPSAVGLPPPPPVTARLEPPPGAGLLLEHLVEQRHHIPIWKEGDIQLKVADIIDETHDVKTFRLVGLTSLLFSFKPGQFVTIKPVIDGREVHRSYSISSSPSRPHCLEITVKRHPGGLVSNWMCDHVKFGDVISLRGPSGSFSCFNFPSRKILFVGAGSGITPVMSMLRWIVDTAADVDAHLFVSAKSPRDIIFRNELNWMSSRHSGIRVGVTCTSRVTGEDAWTGLTGRIDANMLKLLTPDLHERHIFLCGPGPFMEALKESLREIGFSMANLHTESFGRARVAAGDAVEARDVPKRTVLPVMPVAEAPAAPSPTPVEKAVFQVHFARSDKTVSTAGDTSLLELAEANGVEIDYGCRSGMCGACRTKLNKGTVDMSENELPDDERAEGYIYPCVSLPTSDIEVDA